MSKYVPISDLVCDARILQTLDATPPPMNFHADFNIPEISNLQTSMSMNADFGFLNGGPAP